MLGELEQLLGDLPAHDRSAPRRGSGFTSWPVPLFAVVPVLIALAAISAASGRHLIWLALPLAFLITRAGLHYRLRRWRAARGGPWT